MNWQDTVASHPAWEALDAVSRTCDQAEWVEQADARDVRDRALWIVEHLRERCDSGPWAVTGNSLNVVREAATALNNQLAPLRTSYNSSYVQNAHASCDQLLNAVAAWAPVGPEKSVGAATRAANRMQKDVDQALEQAAARLADMTAAVQAQETTMAETVTSLRNQADEIGRKLEAQSTRMDTALNGLTDTFQKAESDRAEKAAEAASKAREETQELQQALKDAAERGRQDDRTAAAAVRDELDDMRVKARKTLGAIGVDATASHYATYAKQERRAGHVWNALAVVIGLAGAAALVWALHSVSAAEHPSWQLMALKAAAGVVLLAVAGYAGKEAAGHRREERRAKAFELGLAAIDPFLANVDDATTEPLRMTLAAQLFARPDEADKGGNTTLPSLGELVQGILAKQAAGK